jgi:hypothetical protein
LLRAFVDAVRCLLKTKERLFGLLMVLEQSGFWILIAAIADCIFGVAEEVVFIWPIKDEGTATAALATERLEFS